MKETCEKSCWLIGEIMIQKDWINWPELKQALADQKSEKNLIGQILVNKGLVSPRQVLRALAYQYGLRYIEFKDIVVSIDAVKAVPLEYAQMHHCMPVEKTARHLTVACSDPSELQNLDLLKRVSGVSEIWRVIACPEDIHCARRWYYELEYRDVA